MAETEQIQKEQEYAKAAACTGILLYNWDPVTSPTSMEVAVTYRAKPGEEGWGISFGGFAEIGRFLNVPVGTIRAMILEALREGGEELLKRLLRIISRKTFMRYAQPIGDFMVRTPDANKVHTPAYLAFPYQPHEKAALSNLKPTEERKEQIAWMTLSWETDIADMSTAKASTRVKLRHGGKRISPRTFYHKHEWPCVFVTLAQTAARGRLWNDRP